MPFGEGGLLANARYTAIYTNYHITLTFVFLFQFIKIAR
jgi:hypothetical protein